MLIKKRACWDRGRFHKMPLSRCLFKCLFYDKDISHREKYVSFCSSVSGLLGKVKATLSKHHQEHRTAEKLPMAKAVRV